jgi:transposase
MNRLLIDGIFDHRLEAFPACKSGCGGRTRFWRQVYSTSANRFFKRWYAWAVRCQLRPVVKVARMLKRHLPNLLTYFLYRITNATTEGFNSVIQALKYAARGFRSFGNYRTRILFFCGKLDLRPQLPCH